MNKIDSHQHFWKYDVNKFSWISDDMPVLKEDFLPEKFQTILAANGIEGTVAVQALQNPEETQFLLDLAEKFPFILGVVGWVDLNSDQLSATLHAYAPFSKLKGFRHLLQDEADPEYILRPAFQRGLAEVFEAGYSYDLLVFPHQLDGVIQTVSNFPEGNFVLDHLAKPSIRKGEIQEWGQRIRDLSSHPRVYCKLSGMVTEADWQEWKATDFFPYLDLVMESFGEDRLMFGSDWPVCNLAANYDQVSSILEKYLEGQPHRVQNKIWAENARHFYRL
ncbi:amidohydrolase family protein [Cyclobacterium plantarum]|uniref:Amidohydrolase family protein n=1 Tax=Cyclobacterium plantarum TaxID=2716263 RepID=A0ABX0HB30_9BACT|nr:amidohydrolase family protein [Cyclobacterium plantarum]NHE57397.1 amidohydrolase family protein [Cyclobacterium plantarum]